MTYELGEHFFRHEYGRLVAMLVRRVGMRHLETVEDSVQSALLSALGYLAAFTPPPALRRLSAQSIAYDFIRDLNGLPTGGGRTVCANGRIRRRRGICRRRSRGQQLLRGGCRVARRLRLGAGCFRSRSALRR